MLDLNYEKIRKYSIIYITLPVVIFILGWIRPQYSFIATGLVVACAYLVIKQRGFSDRKINISWKMLLVLALIALVWCFFAGQGGFYYQSSDHGCRNAIFRDLINFDWPVIYEKYDRAMVYYIGYWMPAALLGKAVLFITGSANAAWLAGSVALLIWSTMGVLIVFLLLIYSVNANTRKKMAVACLMFIFFSGCDIIGQIAYRHQLALHLEWWAGSYQYSSITTCLFWVFNQAVIPWIVVFCLINERSIRNFAFIGVMCLPSGPFPFLGIFVYCICIGCKWGISAIMKKEFGKFARDIFTAQNIMACIIIVPLYYIYYTSNSAVSSGGDNGGLCFFSNEIHCTFVYDLFKYVIFFILEVGIYVFLVYRKNKRNILFYITVSSLMVIALFRMCNSADFAMRVSIPAITVLAYMVIDYVINHHVDLKSSNKKLRYRYVILITVFYVGCFTPGIEFARGIFSVIANGKINVVCDDIVTFDSDGDFHNFVTDDYSQKLFFKYLAR